MAKKEKVKKKRHTFRTIVIVIVVIIILAIIGGSMGGSDNDNEETSTETATGTMTEAVADGIIKEETESEAMTADEALQEYVESNASGLLSKPYTINRADLTAYLADSYPEDEATEAVKNADIDWNNYAIEYENYLLKDKEVYHEDGLREQLATKGFTQDEIDYAIENADWTLQNDILDFVTEYEYNGIDDSSGSPNMFWNVYLNEDADTEWYDEDDLAEVAVECMKQPESQGVDADGYGITVYDADGHVVLIWGSYDDKYTVTQFVWNSGDSNPDRYEWNLSPEEYDEIINAKKDGESSNISEDESDGLAEAETIAVEEETNDVTEDASSTYTQYDSGMYKVGEDIPAGEYVLFADNGSGYFCVSSDSNQSDILFNDNFDYNSIVTVNDGEYLNMNRCHAVPIVEDPEVDTKGTGMFLIGTHLPAGEYKLDSGNDQGYYCIYSSSRQDDIVANDNFQGQDYATVSDGQYLVLSRCTIADADAGTSEDVAEVDGSADVASQYDSGVYKVGTDIPAGEYILFADDSGKGYFCVSTDSNESDILFNDNFEYNSIITINDGDYLDMSRCYAVPISEDPDVNTTGTGMFLVGKHIPAGEYKLDSGNEKGYYCVYSDSRQDNIVANGNFEGQEYVTVSDGQYLVLSRCTIAE